MVNKYLGPDNLPNRMLRELAEEITLVLTSIFTQTWLPTIGPSPSHFCCKLFKHMLCITLETTLTHKLYLPPPPTTQFSRGYSCGSLLLVNLHDLTSIFDQKLQVNLVMFDFCKSFDTVPFQLRRTLC